MRFPEQKFSVLCLCNISSANPGSLARQIADLYLADEMQYKAGASDSSGGKYSPDVSTFAGKYLDARSHQIYSFTASDGNLQAWGSVLKRRSANQFYDLLGNLITFEGTDSLMKARLDVEGTTYFDGAKIPAMHSDEMSLSDFTGQYRSPELDATYTVSLKQGVLILQNGSNPSMKLVPIANDQFDAADFFTVVFDRSKTKHIFGLTLFADAAGGIHSRKRIDQRKTVSEGCRQLGKTGIPSSEICIDGSSTGHK